MFFSLSPSPSAIFSLFSHKFFFKHLTLSFSFSPFLNFFPLSYFIISLSCPPSHTYYNSHPNTEFPLFMAAYVLNPHNITTIRDFSPSFIPCSSLPSPIQ
uniref:Uncharacterized protein n=1 Tax=Cacopsylla melanoneura TaxID=428564 RepID=A0A8D9EC02_9HEMI